MSTRDPKDGSDSDLIATLGAWSDRIGSPFDVAVIQRLANELFARPSLTGWFADPAVSADSASATLAPAAESSAYAPLAAHAGNVSAFTPAIPGAGGPGFGLNAFAPAVPGMAGPGFGPGGMPGVPGVTSFGSDPGAIAMPGVPGVQGVAGGGAPAAPVGAGALSGFAGPGLSPAAQAPGFFVPTSAESVPPSLAVPGVPLGVAPSSAFVVVPSGTLPALAPGQAGSSPDLRYGEEKSVYWQAGDDFSAFAWPRGGLSEAGDPARPLYPGAFGGGAVAPAGGGPPAGGDADPYGRTVPSGGRPSPSLAERRSATLASPVPAEGATASSAAPISPVSPAAPRAVASPAGRGRLPSNGAPGVSLPGAPAAFHGPNGRGDDPALGGAGQETARHRASDWRWDSLDIPHHENLAASLLGAALPGYAMRGVSEPSIGAVSGGERLYFVDEALAFSRGSAVLAQSSTPGPSPAAAWHGGLGDLGITARSFDVEAIRRDFPILRERVNGRPLVWLDNAATTQKPQAVIDRLAYFYEHENSNVHRAAHTLAARSTDAYEAAREKVRRFINASSAQEVVWVRGTTEANNLVAQSWGRRFIERGDEIVLTWLEHHSNIVPWQQICLEKGARLRVAPVDDSGQVLLDEYEKLLNSRTRLVAFTHVSNALGTITPVKQMVEMAHRHGARVLVDGAQAVSHLRVDVQALDCDFYSFSGHKVFGPTGVGVLYGKHDVLSAAPPWQGGGNMISDVTFEKTTYHPPPMRFEAGTGNIADAIGLGAALDYLERLGMENVTRHEHDLLQYATQHLQAIPGLRIIGTAAEKAGVISFVLPGIRTEEIGQALASEGIAVRAGHHCAQPILRRFGLEASVRPSLAIYNNHADVDALVDAVRRIQGGQSSTTR